MSSQRRIQSGPQEGAASPAAIALAYSGLRGRYPQRCEGGAVNARYAAFRIDTGETRLHGMRMGALVHARRFAQADQASSVFLRLRGGGLLKKLKKALPVNQDEKKFFDMAKSVSRRVTHFPLLIGSTERKRHIPRAPSARFLARRINP